ncbi:glycosyltransferase [Methylococcus capsulatus]|uniref:glycosyltransferase n=1 Tax=Methylococcus capsulatus TaxID=414 RepID=UPI002FDAEEEF
MLVITDINTLWRRKPFEALGRLMPVLGARPRDLLCAWRERHMAALGAEGGMVECAVTLPFGWASRTADVSQRWLWRSLTKAVRRTGLQPRALVVTSPHYLALARQLAGLVPIYYYASDDYRSYEGWGRAGTGVLERAVVELAEHSFFVSRALAERAIREYHLVPHRVSVSMNGTEPRFIAAPAHIAPLPEVAAHFARPVAGVVGGVNARLDWRLLRRVAAMQEIGTLLFVGGVDPRMEDDPDFCAVRNHEKSRFVGYRPHGELPGWMQGLDVALIPYRQSEMNYYCSPMRLFDHLASGRPIVATSACAQVSEFKEWVDTGEDDEDFLERLARRLTGGNSGVDACQVQVAREHLWARRAAGLAGRLGTGLLDAAVIQEKQVDDRQGNCR